MKTINIAKLPKRKCGACASTDIQYQIVYRDPDKPGRIIKGTTLNEPTESMVACDLHVAEVTAILLKKAGFIQ